MSLKYLKLSRVLHSQRIKPKLLIRAYKLQYGRGPSQLCFFPCSTWITPLQLSVLLSVLQNLLILTFDFFDVFCLTPKVLSLEAFPDHLPPSCHCLTISPILWSVCLLVHLLAFPLGYELSGGRP